MGVHGYKGPWGFVIVTDGDPPPTTVYMSSRESKEWCTDNTGRRDGTEM